MSAEPNSCAARSIATCVALALAAGVAPLAAAAVARNPALPLAAATSRDAAKGAGIDLRRHVIAGGGGSSDGGAFAITGTIGQADADPLHPATGGAFAVTGGFWAGIATSGPRPDPVFADDFETPNVVRDLVAGGAAPPVARPRVASPAPTVNGKRSSNAATAE